MAWLSLSLLSNRFPVLHGLRAIAIVSVLQLHLTLTMLGARLAPTEGWTRVSRGVWFGMDLFFVLSGFLIGTILLPSRSGDEPRGIVRFYARRTFRIVPLYWVVLTGIALAFTLTAVQRENLVYEYAYLTNYREHLSTEPFVMPHAWSLAVEEHFYLAVPLVALGLARYRAPATRVAILGVLWLVPLFVRAWTYATHDGAWTTPALFRSLYIPTHTRFDTLVAGIALAYVQRYWGSQLRVRLQTPWRRWALLTIPALALYLLLGPMAGAPGLEAVLAWGTVTSVGYVALLLWALNTSGPIVRLLSSRPFLHFATLGYGIYLVHPVVLGHAVLPVLFGLHRETAIEPGMLWLLGLVLVTALSALVAYVLHLVVEKPSLSLRDRIAP